MRNTSCPNTPCAQLQCRQRVHAGQASVAYTHTHVIIVTVEQPPFEFGPVGLRHMAFACLTPNTPMLRAAAVPVGVIQIRPCLPPIVNRIGRGLLFVRIQPILVVPQAAHLALRHVVWFAILLFDVPARHRLFLASCDMRIAWPMRASVLCRLHWWRRTPVEGSWRIRQPVRFRMVTGRPGTPHGISSCSLASPVNRKHAYPS